MRRLGAAPLLLLRAARPKQWSKNILVFAAPAAAGVLTHGDSLGRSIAAFWIICAASSATYLINDVHDVASDRADPVKRSRPIASGRLPAPTAITVALLLMIGSLVGAASLSPALALVVGVYMLLTATYTFLLRGIVLFDIAAVSVGFVLRAVAGAVTADVPLSSWFVIVTSFGSLFMVSGKRHAEHARSGDSIARATLGEYTASYLRYVWSLSSAVTITAYCLWSFEQSRGQGGFSWFTLSVLPFTLATMQYALLLDGGHGGEPEDVILSDRRLQLLGVLWLGMFAAAIYTR